MPYYLLHAGTSIQRMSSQGVIATLALPSGVTVSSTRAMRTAILNRRVFICRGPTKNLQFDPQTLTLYPVSLTAPVAAPTSAAGAAGLLRGRYRYRYSFARKVGGVVVAESGMSPASTPLDVTDLQVAVAAIVAGPATCNCRRLYRTLNEGEDYYLIVDLDDNTTLTYTDAFSDYDVQLIPTTSILSAPPGSDTTDYFRSCTSWRQRVWATSKLYVDRVYFSGVNAMHQWGASDFFSIGPEGMDNLGVIGFFNRRDELGLPKRRAIWKIVGETLDTFQAIQVVDGIGCCSPGSIITIRDKTYFLYDDGVYEWGPEGLVSLTEDKVHPWFNTDDYFNRMLFANSFALWNPKDDTYNLHLAAAGSTKLDRWISFDLQKRLWLGPHRTIAFEPTVGGLVEDDDGVLWPVLGSTAGYIYQQNAPTRSDDTSAIAMDVITAAHGAGDPDLEHYWGELSVLTKVEPAGTLVVTPRVGQLASPEQPAILHDLTRERQRHRRLGVGVLLSLRFQNEEVGQDVELYGYEVPVHVVGRR